MYNIEVEVYKDVQDQISRMISKYKSEIYDIERKRSVNEIFNDIKYLISYLYLLKKQHMHNLEYRLLIDKFIAEVSLELEMLQRRFETINNSKRR